jgi:glycosyltransferase involved in cell wall biosynthesis
MGYTVVIPAHNAAPFIADTVASVLAQSVTPARVIVVDDGSADDTADVIRGLRGPIDYVWQANTGPGGATNRGLAMVETEFVATLDHDDLWVPNKIERQLARFAAEPEISAVFGHVVEFRGDAANAHYDRPYEGWTRTTMLMRTSVAKAAEPMTDHPSRLGEVVEWLAKLREQGHVLAMVPDILSLRRVHVGSLTNRERGELARSYLHVAHSTLLRHRRAANGRRKN